MLRNVLLSILLCVALPVAASNDISKINGSISVASGESAGELDTINGSIRIGNGATVIEAETVNGAVTLGSDVTIEAIETVNGAIEVGERSRVAKDIEAVNGRVILSEGVQVMGNVENVNGEIRLNRAHVAGSIKTTSGNIDIGADSRVDRGILVEKPRGWFNLSGRPPRIVIGPRAIVNGTLDFEREVELYVSDSATIGTVKGATVNKFSGDRP